MTHDRANGYHIVGVIAVLIIFLSSIRFAVVGFHDLTPAALARVACMLL